MKQKTQSKSKTYLQKSGFHSQLPQSTGDTELIHQKTETNTDRRRQVQIQKQIRIKKQTQIEI